MILSVFKIHDCLIFLFHIFLFSPVEEPEVGEEAFYQVSLKVSNDISIYVGALPFPDVSPLVASEKCLSLMKLELISLLSIKS